MNRPLLFCLTPFFATVFATPESSAQVEELLPDVIVREAELRDWDIVTDGEQVLLRFGTGTPNIGDGPLHISGVFPINPDDTQDVVQRIFKTDGSYRDREAGKFEFHVDHDHFHFEDWASFRLREVTEDGGVGEIIVESEKTSFCLIDSEIHDGTLPGFPGTRNYRSCGQTFQGISVGWVDIYPRELYGQNLNIKGVPHGTYWLETEVDPANHIQEKNEDNNIARILIEVGDPTLVNGPLEVRPEDYHVEDHHHPDLRIGKSPNPNSHVGNDVYEPNGGVGHDHHHLPPRPGAWEQVLRLRAPKKKKLVFFSSLQNESSHSNTYIIQCIGAKSRKTKVVHIDTSGGTRKNVTARLNRAGLLADMGVDELKTFRTRVSVPRKMRKRRNAKRQIRNSMSLKVWNATKVDQAWIHLRFR